MMQEAEQARGAQTYATIQIPPGPRLGNVVLEVEGLEKDYGDKVLFKDLTFKLPPNGIVGVIGPNGAGKSTLFQLITGQETPDAGTIRLGETVKLAYVDQSRDALDPKKTVWQEISSGLDVLKVGDREIHTRSYVGSFNFKGGDQQKKVGQLSGGERNRVHLAKTLTEGGNVILLDEPTNDLDIETLQNLEEALEDFAGCAVVISHDRWFLDRLCHPHPGLRGRQPRRVVRGQLRSLRGRQEAPPRRRQPDPQAHQVPEVRALARRTLAPRSGERAG